MLVNIMVVVRPDSMRLSWAILGHSQLMYFLLKQESVEIINCSLMSFSCLQIL